MTRTKWLALSLSQSIPQIADSLNQHQFYKGKTTGFELVDFQKSRVRGKFIEEIITNEVVIDPFGEEILNSARRYSVFDFQVVLVKKHHFLIRITTPPRSLKSFIGELSEAFGFGFAVEPLKIDILEFVQHLRNQSGTQRWAIRKVRIDHIQLSVSSLAKIEVISRVDAYQDLKKHIDVNKATLERATVELRDEGITSEIELVSTGVISGDLDVIDQLMPTFQRYFAQSE